MRKLVNGKIVDIKNIELFEEAAEGVAIGRTLSNVLPSEGLNIDFKLVDKIIAVYKRFYDALPFPLYGVDTDIKYCAAGLVIRKELSIKNKMWLDNGLFILLDENRMLVLGFVNNSWGIVRADEIKEDNVSVQKFRNTIGFEEFIWVVASLFKGEGTEKYYRTFMQQFVEACGNQPVVLRWELGNILQFGPIPDRLTLLDDKIVNLENGDCYSLDIFIAGSRPNKTQSQVWSLGNDSVETVENRTNLYGYDLYKKIQAKDLNHIKLGDDKIKPTEMNGMNSLFCVLCSIKSASDSDTFPMYNGFTANGNFIFTVDNRVFIAKSNVYVEAKEIARGVEIYAYKDKYVYISKPKVIAAGIKKETIYSYNLDDGSLRLCKIQFVRI